MTRPSKRWPRATSSIESAITSRETSEARIPEVPIETPSDTAIVLNSIGVPPASRTPRLTCTARSRWLRLHGIVSIQVVPTPTIGFARSSSVKPVPFSIARAPARSGPSVRAALRRLAGSDGVSYGVVTGVSSLDRVGRVAAPFAERAGIEPDVVAPGEHQPLGDDRRGDARAAVRRDLGRLGRVGGQGLLEERVPRARDPPGDRVERLDVAAPALRGARVEKDERRVAEARADLVRLDHVVVADVRDERRPLDARLLGLERSRVGANVERPRRVVPEVAEEPPAARGPARALVVARARRCPARSPLRRRPRRARAGPGSGWRPPTEGSTAGSRAASPGRDGPRRGRAPPRRPRADGSPPGGRSQRASRRDGEHEHVVLGEPILRALPRTPPRRPAQTITVGPEPDSVAPRAPGGRSARSASSVGRRAVRLVQPVVEARRRRGRRLRRPRPRRAARRGAAFAAASACGTVDGSARRDASVDVRSRGTSANGIERQRCRRCGRRGPPT